MASAHASISSYISIEEAAQRLDVPTHYLLEILDGYGITPDLRKQMNRKVTIRSADLRSLRRVLREETHQGAA